MSGEPQMYYGPGQTAVVNDIGGSCILEFEITNHIAARDMDARATDMGNDFNHVSETARVVST